MNRAGPIFAVIGIGFLLYITMRGNLAKYVALLWTPGPIAALTPTSSGAVGATPAAPAAPTTGGGLFSVNPNAFSWGCLWSMATLQGGGTSACNPGGGNGLPSLPALGH